MSRATAFTDLTVVVIRWGVKARRGIEGVFVGFLCEEVLGLLSGVV